MILQLSDQPPPVQRAIGIAFCFGIDSLTCGGLAQLGEDCTVVCIDGIATDARFTGERGHGRAARAVVQETCQRFAQTRFGAGASPRLRGG